MKNCSLFLSDGPAIRAPHGCTKAYSAALRVPCWDDVAIRRARQRLTEPIADRSSRTAPALARRCAMRLRSVTLATPDEFIDVNRVNSNRVDGNISVLHQRSFHNRQPQWKSPIRASSRAPGASFWHRHPSILSAQYPIRY